MMRNEKPTMVASSTLLLLFSLLSCSFLSSGAFSPSLSYGTKTCLKHSASVVVEPLVETPTKKTQLLTPPTLTNGRKNRVRRQPKERRVLKTVSPLGLSPVEREYLASVALQLAKHSSYNTLVFTAVNKLDQDASFVERLSKGARASTLVPRIMALVYSRQKNYQVKENVVTVTNDSSTGKIVADMDAVLQAGIERAAYMLLEDLNNIREGLYPLPSELKLVNQAGRNAVPSAMRELYNGFKFALGDTTYIGQADYDDPNEPSPYLKELASGLNLPSYYETDFHSVPGGFLSPKHPPVYDLVSETVFVGTHFMSRRMAIRPLALEIKARGPKNLHGRGLRLLDLGTGNGSFLIQLQEAFPSLELCGLDLSPAMLDYARQSFRTHPSIIRATDAPTITLMRANMEEIPVENESFDFVTQSNCFHEMPEDAIRNTAAEIARVLKPGGLFVHHDAVQMEDDPPTASSARPTFDSNFNEPYILDFMENVDLDQIFADQGMQPACPPRPYRQAAVRCYQKGN